METRTIHVKTQSNGEPIVIPNKCSQCLIALPLLFKEVPKKKGKLLLAGLKQVETLQELSFRQENCRKGALACTDQGGVTGQSLMLDK